jgi:hypothetical protein
LHPDFESPGNNGPETGRGAGHLVYNVINWNRSVEDAINCIVLNTAFVRVNEEREKSTGGFITMGHTFYEQIFDIEQEGFVGFVKPVFQSNGVFGEVEPLRKTMRQYARMKYPPSYVNFQLPGIAGLKPTDVISLDGQRFCITEINHEISKPDNKWWMTVSAYWYTAYMGDLGVPSSTGDN